jgi:alpha-galactosidase
MTAHNMPKPEGKLPGPILSAGPCWVSTSGINTAEQQMLFIDRYQEEQVKLNYWWVDAGWYVCDNYWPKTGTWEVDKNRFPNGLRQVFDYAHSKNIKTILWFQPEVVASGTWLYENHPEWLLTPPPNPEQSYEKASRLLNLGNPEALQWLIDHVDMLLTQEGVDLYREDFNMGFFAYPSEKVYSREYLFFADRSFSPKEQYTLAFEGLVLPQPLEKDISGIMYSVPTEMNRSH